MEIYPKIIPVTPSYLELCVNIFACFTGRYYYEATVTDEGLCRVGWSTEKATLDLGTDKWGFGFGGTGKKSYGKQFDSYGEVIVIVKYIVNTSGRIQGQL